MNPSYFSRIAYDTIWHFSILFQSPEDEVNFFDPDACVEAYDLSASKSNSTILEDKSTEPLSDSD